MEYVDYRFFRGSALKLHFRNNSPKVNIVERSPRLPLGIIRQYSFRLQRIHVGFSIILQDIPTMFDETTFQTCVRAVRVLVLIKPGKDISEELQSVFKPDETLNNLGKLVKEGNGTGRVVEMTSNIVSAIISG